MNRQVPNPLPLSTSCLVHLTSSGAAVVSGFGSVFVAVFVAVFFVVFGAVFGAVFFVVFDFAPRPAARPTLAFAFAAGTADQLSGRTTSGVSPFADSDAEAGRTGNLKDLAPNTDFIASGKWHFRVYNGSLCRYLDGWRMDEILEVLASFVRNEAGVQERICAYFESRACDGEMYRRLFGIALDAECGNSVRLAAVIQIRNMYLAHESMRGAVVELFVEGLGRVGKETLNGFVMLAEVVVDGARSGIDWWSLCEELAKEEKVGFLVPLVPLSASCSERMGKFWGVLVACLRGPMPECVVAKIVCRACRVNRVPDGLVGELGKVALEMACQGAFVTKSIRIFEAILRDSENDVVHGASAVLKAGVEQMAVPKVAIRVFGLLRAMVQNEQTCASVVTAGDELVRHLYFPFFAVSYSESLRDFVCENDFDSFGARDDPKAAAYRSLEVIASMRSEFVGYLVSFWNERTTPEDVYAKTHMLITGIKHAPNDILTEILEAALPLLQSPMPLVQCSGLLVLRAVRTNGVDHIVHRVVELLNESTFVAYFAATALLRMMTYSGTVTLSQDQIINIITRTLVIAEEFGAPELLDIVTHLYQSDVCTELMIRSAPSLLSSSFGLLEMNMLVELMPNSVCPSFHLLLAMMYGFKDCHEPEQLLCQQVASNSLGLVSYSLQHEKITYLSPLLELLCNSVFYSPNPINDIWTAFDILLPAITDMDPLSVDNAMTLFSNIALKETNAGLIKTLPTLYTQIRTTTVLTQRSYFLASVLTLFPELDALYADAAEELAQLADSEELNYVEDCLPVLLVMIHNKPSMFLQLITTHPSILEDFLATCPPPDLEPLTPVLSPLVPPDTLSYYVAQADDPPPDTPPTLDIKRVPLTRTPSPCPPVSSAHPP